MLLEKKIQDIALDILKQKGTRKLTKREAHWQIGMKFRMDRKMIDLLLKEMASNNKIELNQQFVILKYNNELEIK